MPEFLQGLLCGGIASFFGCYLAVSHLHGKRLKEIGHLSEMLTQSREDHEKALAANSSNVKEIERLKSDRDRLLRTGLFLSSVRDQVKELIDAASLALSSNPESPE